MSTINSTDIIFASLSQHGSSLGQVKLLGVTSLSDIIKRLRESIPGLKGLVNIRVRNATCGWQQLCPVMFERREPRWVQPTLF